MDPIPDNGEIHRPTIPIVGSEIRDAMLKELGLPLNLGESGKSFDTESREGYSGW